MPTTKRIRPCERAQKIICFHKLCYIWFEVFVPLQRKVFSPVTCVRDPCEKTPQTDFVWTEHTTDPHFASLVILILIAQTTWRVWGLMLLFFDWQFDLLFQYILSKSVSIANWAVQFAEIPLLCSFCMCILVRNGFTISRIHHEIYLRDSGL